MKKVFMLLVMLFTLTCFAAPKNVLIYYGWLNSFNSATNQWNNNAVIADIGGNYDIVVFGDGLQNPSHGDYSNTQTIISGLKSSYPSIEIFGYVTVNQDLSAFQSKASQWDTLNVDGIFFDEAGYDFGKTRQELNQRITFTRELNNSTRVFVNAWNIKHIIGTENDPSYPNTTYNSTADASLISSTTDYYLLENLTVSNGSYESMSQWFSRANTAKLIQSSFGLKSIAVSVIDDADSSGQDKFNNVYYGSHIWDFYGVGSSHLNYGASDAKTKFWTRPSLSHL